MRFKRFMVSALVAGSLLGSAVGVGAAGGDMPGTPGEANCNGQTTAFIAQLSKNGDGFFPEGFRGIGGVGRATGLSTQEIQAIVNAFCSQTA